MGIEIQNFNFKPGQTTTLTFNNPIQNWVAGISYFYLTYEETDELLQQVEITISTNLLAVGNQLELTVDAAMLDSHRHTLDTANSQIFVTCVALTGSDDGNTIMTNLRGIVAGSSQGVSLPGAGNTVLQSFLAGFNFSNPKNERLKTLKAGTSCSVNDTLATVSVGGSMTNDSGVITDEIHIDAGFLATSDAQPGFDVQVVTAQSPGAQLDVTLNSPITDPNAEIGILLQSFNATFAGRDRRVYWIKAGCPGYSTVGNPPGVLTLRGPGAALGFDSHTSEEDDTVSSATVLLIVPQ